MKVAEKLEVVKNYVAGKTGHTVNRYGHIHVESQGREYRYKFLTNVMRKEVKVRYDDGSTSWMRVNSYNINDAYKNLVNTKLVA